MQQDEPGQLERRPRQVEANHLGYEHAPGDERDSGMSISFSLSIGYQRRRPNTLGDRTEARIDSLGLLIVGSVIGVAIVIVVLPRFLDWLSSL